MSITPIQNVSITDALVQKLEEMIVDGIFKPGDTLPPERQLASDFAVSRGSLRQALSVLEHRGLILSRQGGGNYVCDVAKNSFSDPLVELMTRHHELKFQIIELRQMLEGAAAYHAAERATDEDKETIRERLADLQRIIPRHKPEAEAKADLELHLAIADAAHNAPLSLMIRNIYSLLLSEIEENLNLIHQREKDATRLHRQHEQLVECIVNGDSEGARSLANNHLELIRQTFIENGLIEKRIEVAELRNYLSTKK